MVSGIDSALSGLNAATKRIGVAANNIANQSSSGNVVNGVVVDKPYVPQQLVQTTNVNGGVSTKVQDVNPASTPTYAPNDPGADASGVAQFPNVDIANELVNAKLASYDAQANIKVIKAQDKMLQSVIDIIA